jgi:hypothetical protein
MTLSTKTLAELARLNVGAGLTSTLQATATVANGAPVGALAGVDTSGAVMCEVEVVPDTGSPVWTVWGYSAGRWKELANLIGKTNTATRPLAEVPFVGTLERVYIELTDMGGAASVAIYVSPCNG